MAKPLPPVIPYEQLTSAERALVDAVRRDGDKGSYALGRRMRTLALAKGILFFEDNRGRIVVREDYERQMQAWFDVAAEELAGAVVSAPQDNELLDATASDAASSSDASSDP